MKISNPHIIIYKSSFEIVIFLITLLVLYKTLHQLKYRVLDKNQRIILERTDLTI